MTAPDLHHRPSCDKPTPAVTVTAPPYDSATTWRVATCPSCGAVAVEPLDTEED
ncbi:MAG: hypothetical protein R2737_02040 [Candidatus Nanopelagicales bacterium]